MLHTFSDVDATAHAITEATLRGTLNDAVKTVLATKRADLLRVTAGLLGNTVDTLINRGCDPEAVSYCDARALAFLRKSSAMRKLELCAAPDQEWRLGAMADMIQHYRKRIASIKVVATLKPDSEQAMRITAMPERLTTQTVARDAENEITATHTVERDA